MIAAALFAVIAFAAILPSAKADSTNWNLKKTIAVAIERSPSLETSQRNLSIKSLEYETARASNLPVLELRASHGLSGSDPAAVPAYGTNPESTHWVSSASLGVSETLYNNGLNGLRREVAEKSLQLARIQFETARDKLVLDLTEAYLRYSLAEALEDVQKTQQDLLKKQFNTVSTQYSQGVKTRRDYLRFKSDVRKNEISVISAKAQVTRTRADVLKMAGISETEGTSLQLIPIPIELAAVKARAKRAIEKKISPESHRDAKARNLENEIAESEYSSARRSNGIEITWTAEAGYGSSNYWRTGRSFEDGKSGSWNTLVNFKWTLWDWGAKSNARATALETKMQTLARLRADTLELESVLQALDDDLKRGYQNYGLSEELLDLELKNYEAIEADFRMGRVSYLDLNFGLNQLLNARVGLYTAFYDLRSLLAKQSYHEATIYEASVPQNDKK